MQAKATTVRANELLLAMLLLATLLAAAMPRPAAGAPPPCAGDCDGDGQITVTEIVAAVNAATGGPLVCASADVDGDGAVQVGDLVALVRMAFDGCPAPFDYAATTIEALGVTVTLDGQPARNVSVTLVDALVEPTAEQTIEELTTGNVYYQGMTDAAGRVTAMVKIPTRFDAVDVIVSMPDAVGPYTVEALRTLWGPFAPAARVTVVRGFLADVNVGLRHAE